MRTLQKRISEGKCQMLNPFDLDRRINMSHFFHDIGKATPVKGCQEADDYVSSLDYPDLRPYLHHLVPLSQVSWYEWVWKDQGIPVQVGVFVVTTQEKYPKDVSLSTARVFMSHSDFVLYHSMGYWTSTPEGEYVDSQFTDPCDDRVKDEFARVLSTVFQATMNSRLGSKGSAI